MAPLFGTHTKNTTVIKLRGYIIELQGSSKVGIPDTLVQSFTKGRKKGGYDNIKVVGNEWEGFKKMWME